jgi:hypothetical protein
MAISLGIGTPLSCGGSGPHFTHVFQASRKIVTTYASLGVIWRIPD